MNASFYINQHLVSRLSHRPVAKAFCDSDDTHTASISYFAYVRLERR